MLDFDVWKYAQENTRKKRRKEAEEFLDKVGYDFDKNKLDLRDSLAYDFVKPEVDQLVRGHNLSLNDIASVAIDTLKYTPEALGEMVADGVIASEHLQNMKDTNKRLINKYGKNTNAADGTDNYYHALLQCQLAKISPESKDYGLRAGYLKEVYDYHKKKKYMPYDVLVEDMRKDLKNNFHGSRLGERYRNTGKSCYELLDDYRPKNMKNENIK